MTDIPVKALSEIEVKSEVSENDKILILDSETEEARLASKDELKGDKGDKGDTGETGPQGPQGIQGIQGPKGDKGDTGAKGDKGDTGNTGPTGPKGDKGDKGDTGVKGDKGDTGATGPQGATGPKGNGITTVTTSKSGKTTTVTMNYDSGSPTVFQVQDGADGQGSGDMSTSTYDPNNVAADAFDYENFINTPDIPTNVSDLDNDSGFITGIDSNDVTTALGYTPADSASLGTAATKDTGTSSGNVPVLDANGKLNTTILPALAITDTFTVSTTSDLVGLTSAEKGDVAIVTTDSETYILSADPYSTASNWKKLATPTDTVTSVNSKTGAVTLDADDISDSTTTNKFVTATDKSTWSGKQDALTLPATPTQGNLVVRGANNKTIADGGAIPTGVPSGGNNGDVLTNVSGTPTWAAPSGGIENVTTGTTSTVTGIWAGTEAEYGNITPSSTVLYFTF